MTPSTPPLPADAPAEILDRGGAEPRRPATDPALGIAVAPAAMDERAHRIVTVGDSVRMLRCALTWKVTGTPGVLRAMATPS